MSQRDFIVRRQIEALHPPFYAIIMAAMRKADTENTAKLREAFPQVWAELSERYWNGDPDGWLPGEERG